MNNIVKPLSVVRSEFIQSLTDLINNSALPPFIVESILKDMYADVRTLSQRQLEIDSRNYYEAVNKLKSTNKEGG